MDNIKISAVKAPWYGGIELLIHTENEKTRSIVKPSDITITSFPKTEAIQPEPSLKIGMHEAQVLMDQLWECGLRPSEGSGSAGQLAATQKHLNDMRNLVFKNKPEDMK